MGDFAVTSGADRALRIWQRTEEPFFVEEEKEKRLESLFEADLEVLNCPVYGPALMTYIVHLFLTCSWCNPSTESKSNNLRPGCARKGAHLKIIVLKGTWSTACLYLQTQN